MYLWPCSLGNVWAFGFWGSLFKQDPDDHWQTSEDQRCDWWRHSSQSIPYIHMFISSFHILLIAAWTCLMPDFCDEYHKVRTVLYTHAAHHGAYSSQFGCMLGPKNGMPMIIILTYGSSWQIYPLPWNLMKLPKWSDFTKTFLGNQIYMILNPNQTFKN